MTILIAPEVDNFLKMDDVDAALAYYKQQGVELNYEDEEGFSLASLAALNGANKLFALTIEFIEGNDLSNINHPIRIAAEERNAQMLEMLLEKFRAETKIFNAILSFAIKHDCQSVVENNFPYDNFSLLKKVMQSGMTSKDELVHSRLANIVARSDEQDDIGALSVQFDCHKTLSSLIDSGYEFSKYNDFDTLMAIAVDNKSFKTAAILLDAGVTMSKEQIYAAIQYVASTFDEEMLTLLRQDSFFSTVANQDGDNNLLLSAIKKKNQPLIDWCLDKKVNVGRVDDEMQSAVHLCVDADLPDTIDRLKSMGAEINLRDNFGNNPLLMAVSEDKEQCVRAILRDASALSAGINERNHQEVDSISLAIHRKNYEILTELLFKAPDLQFKDLRDFSAPELMGEDFILDKSELEAAEFKVDGIVALHHLGYNFDLKNDLGQNIINIYARHNSNLVNIINLLDVGVKIEERANDGLDSVEVCIAKGLHEKLDLILNKRKYDFEPARLLEVLSYNKFPKNCIKVLFSHKDFLKSDASKKVVESLIDKNQSIEDCLYKMPGRDLRVVLMYAAKCESVTATKEVIVQIDKAVLETAEFKELLQTLSKDFRSQISDVLGTVNKRKIK